VVPRRWLNAGARVYFASEGAGACWASSAAGQVRRIGVAVERRRNLIRPDGSGQAWWGITVSGTVLGQVQGVGLGRGRRPGRY
jgi:hypothetical protein